jgi:hypothetical protein
MSSYLPYFVNGCISAVVGLASGWFGHILAGIRESACRRAAFRDLLSVQIDRCKRVNVAALQPGQLFDIHRAALGVVADESARMRGHIRRGNISPFDTARSAYQALRQVDVEPHDRFDPATNPTAILFANYEQGRNRIVVLLQELIASAE